MSGGQATIPLVVRMAAGAGLRAAAQHSDTFYALFTHVPGLKVVVPATPAEAQGLLLAAIEDDDPVIFIEHMALYRDRGPVPVAVEPLPLGRLVVERAGDDVTIACVGQALRAGLDAAERLAADSVVADVLSLRTLRPLDVDGIVGSVRRTGRLVWSRRRRRAAPSPPTSPRRSPRPRSASLRHPPLRVTAPTRRCRSAPSRGRIPARRRPGRRRREADDGLTAARPARCAPSPRSGCPEFRHPKLRTPGSGGETVDTQMGVAGGRVGHAVSACAAPRPARSGSGAPTPR